MSKATRSVRIESELANRLDQVAPAMKRSSVLERVLQLGLELVEADPVRLLGR